MPHSRKIDNIYINTQKVRVHKDITYSTILDQIHNLCSAKEPNNPKTITKIWTQHLHARALMTVPRLPFLFFKRLSESPQLHSTNSLPVRYQVSLSFPHSQYQTSTIKTRCSIYHTISLIKATDINQAQTMQKKKKHKAQKPCSINLHTKTTKNPIN